VVIGSLGRIAEKFDRRALSYDHSEPHRWHAAQAGRVVGIDVSVEMLRMARRVCNPSACRLPCSASQCSDWCSGWDPQDPEITACLSETTSEVASGTQTAITPMLGRSPSAGRDRRVHPERRRGSLNPPIRRAGGNYRRTRAGR
jgi:hypothetical protein